MKKDDGGGFAMSRPAGPQAGEVSHDRRDESPEAKAMWFQSLPVEERMDMLCAFANLALSLNPRLPDLKDARSASARNQIIERP